MVLLKGENLKNCTREELITDRNIGKSKIADGVIAKYSRVRNCRSRNKTSDDAEKEY